MKRNSIYKQIALSLLLLVGAVGSAWGQQNITFTHSQGKLSEAEFNKSVINEQYYQYTTVGNSQLQQTHTYTKTVYVKKGKVKTLKPFNYANSYLNTYYRWFMYNDEENVESLEEYLNIEDLKTGENGSPIYYKSDHGYITNQISTGEAAFPEFNTTDIPEGGIQIAMDISCKENINLTSDITEITEPTLAYRYIFDIRDADKLMENINSKNYIETVRKEVFATANMFFQVRLTHPLEDYYVDEKGYLNRENISITATRTYTDNGETTIETISDLNSTSGKIYIHENNAMLIIPQPEVGVYTVTLSCDDTKLDEYRITFLSIYSAGMFMEEDLQMKSGKFGHLSQDSLDILVNDGHAKLLGTIDFDQRESDNEEFSYLDHLNDTTYYPYPILPWSQSSYAWMDGAGRTLDYASYRIITTSDNAPYKSALDYVLDSDEMVFGHGKNVTDARQDAYMYVNVANEPGKMLELDWNEEICPNSRLYLTFWINEFSYGESGNVEISVTGIKKGENGNEGAHENLRTYITGYVPKYIEKYESNRVQYNSTESNTYEYQHPLYNNGTDVPKDCRGHWMQVCYSFITGFDPDEYERFVLTFNNNTKHSDGGDFGIDDIRVYAVNPTVIAQETRQCGEVYEVDIRLPYEQLAYTYAGDPREENGYFSFWKQEEDKWIPVHYNYNNSDDKLDPNNDYGTFSFHTQYDQNKEEGEQEAGEMYQWVDAGGERFLVFNTAPTINDLNPDDNYIVVFYSTEGEAQNWIEEGTLNFENPCLIYDEFKVYRSQVVLIDGQPASSEMNICYNQSPTIRPVMQVNNPEQGEEEYEYGGYYDIFKGSLNEYEKYQEAISHFHADFPTAKDPAEVEIKTGDDAQFTSDDKTLLTEHAEQFIFHCQQFTAEYPGDLENPTEETSTYTIIPIIPSEEAGTDNTIYCWEPYEYKITFTGDAPIARIGFHDVAYGDYEPSLRIGLEDLEKISYQSLTIPLQNVKEEVTSTENNKFVYLDISGESTNDPTVLEYITDKSSDPWCDDFQVGTISEFTASADGRNENKLVIQLDKLNGKNIEFKEGYFYTFRVQYKEKEDTEGSSCLGDLRFTMHVVPKYQKWTGTATDDWNDDTKWIRSTAEEMKYPIGYTDYADPYEHKGYAPMYFTNITIPRKGQVEQYNEGTIEGETETTHPILKLRENATENIEYDLMVEPNTDGDNYYCIPYYMNRIADIHFEPNAEMLHAELLDYKKAWVDYELEKERWYTLASPLNGVVAGDFYTDSDKGTEEQEYFTDIYFDKEDYTESKPNGYDKANNRFEPSVYQRGWKESNTMVIKGENDSKDVAISSGIWSGAYNDVKEAYTPGTGFSLKVQDIADDAKAIFRLPKADTEYGYFEYNGTTATTTETVNRDQDGIKLKSDDLKDAEEGYFAIDLPEANGNYYLIGNPFMTSLNMDEFFKENTGLQKKYWIVTKDNQEVAVGDENAWVSTGSDIVPPLHSFFVVKDNTSSDISEVTFTQKMQTLGETTNEDADGNEGTTFFLTVQNAAGKTSRAAIAYDIAADKDYAADEDAELFLDSNLSDVPAIYTVAGSTATSINRTSELYNIPVGIYGNSNELVTLSFSGLKHIGSATLYDAEEKTETPLREGKTIQVPGNTSGRYFLRAGTPTANETIATGDIQIYSLSGNRVMVTATTPLKDIRVYDMGGALVKHVKAGVCSFELYLANGIYVVTAENAEGETETAKVIVR